MPRVDATARMTSRTRRPLVPAPSMSTPARRTTSDRRTRSSSADGPPEASVGSVIARATIPQPLRSEPRHHQMVTRSAGSSHRASEGPTPKAT